MNFSEAVVGGNRQNLCVTQRDKQSEMQRKDSYKLQAKLSHTHTHLFIDLLGALVVS